ncbi:hypothetical protein SK128_010477 [Halocaridina rubra]|uniref:Chitin-binding type-2 domain-containing protein n=1 Tax=Halocaridina rubra TaxID=373956 RepID=A0AAN8XCF2_HALRR
MKMQVIFGLAIAILCIECVKGNPASVIAPPEVSALCPNPPGRYPLLLPNPMDCGSFYICSWDNVAFLQHCPASLHFNPDLQVCDYPEKVSCSNDNNTPTVPDLETLAPTEEPESSEEEEDGDVVEIVTGPPQVSAQCPPFSHDRVAMVPDPTNCANFYMCLENGSTVLQKCPPELFFNPQFQVCDFPQNVICGSA